jgi:hypothetical protein
MKRYTLCLSQEAADQLSEMSDDTGFNKSELLRRALALYLFVIRENKRGNRVVIDPCGISLSESPKP